MKIWLVRHGQSKWQINHSFNSDSEITHLGKIQAGIVNNYIRNFINLDPKNSIVYVSPLRRTLQTVQSLDIDYVLDPKIKEAPFHVSSSLPQFPYPFIYERELSEDPKYKKFKMEVRETLENIISKYNNKNIYLYTHGGVIKTILRIIHDNDSICYKINNCSITKIVWDRDRWQINVLNDVSFLPKHYVT